MNKNLTYYTLGLAGACFFTSGCDQMTTPENPPALTETTSEEYIEEGSVTVPMERESDIVAKRLENIENKAEQKVMPEPSQVEYRGLITAVEPTTIKIRYPDNKEETFALSEELEILRNEAEQDNVLTLEALQVGQQVILLAERKDDQNNGVIQVVRTIQIVPEATPQPAPAPETPPQQNPAPSNPAPETQTPQEPVPQQPQPSPGTEPTSPPTENGT